MSAPTLRGICAASVFFGLALTLLPEGRGVVPGPVVADPMVVQIDVGLHRAAPETAA